MPVTEEIQRIIIAGGNASTSPPRRSAKASATCAARA